MKLYFTDPIKALYMMKEFGVIFEMIDYLDDNLKEESYGELLEYAESFKKEFADKNKIYVAKESESIFEPKEGDLSIYEDSLFCFRENIEESEGTQWECQDGLVDARGGWWEKVINNDRLRDDKHFFMPKEI